jgi:hypothetical protein
MIPTKGKFIDIITADDSYETITDLMTLQDQIESFQKLIFTNFRGTANNECRISALVPLVKESFGIYKFITSMLRAMHRREYKVWDKADSQEPTISMPCLLFVNDTMHSITICDASIMSARI